MPVHNRLASDFVVSIKDKTDRKIARIQLSDLEEGVWVALLVFERGDDIVMRRRAYECLSDSPFILLREALVALDSDETEEQVMANRAENRIGLEA